MISVCPVDPVILSELFFCLDATVSSWQGLIIARCGPMNASGSQSTIAAAILAGGDASRYGGTAKGALVLPDGETIISRLIRQIGTGGTGGIADIVIAGNDPKPYRNCGLSIVQDHQPGLGPLGGVVGALAHFEGFADAVLFMPCDLPGMTASEIKTLCTVFRRTEAPLVAAQTGCGFWHPLCAVIQVDLRPAIERALPLANRSIRDLWRELGGVPVAFADDRPFFNVNTPQDMDRWRQLPPT